MDVGFPQMTRSWKSRFCARAWAYAFVFTFFFFLCVCRELALYALGTETS